MIEITLLVWVWSALLLQWIMTYYEYQNYKNKNKSWEKLLFKKNK